MLELKDSIWSGSSNLYSNSSLRLHPYNDTTNIGIAGGAGAFSLSAAELAMMNPGTVVIGNSSGGFGTQTTSTTTVGALDYSTQDYNLTLYNNTINLTGDIAAPSSRILKMEQTIGTFLIDGTALPGGLDITSGVIQLYATDAVNGSLNLNTVDITSQNSTDVFVAQGTSGSLTMANVVYDHKSNGGSTTLTGNDIALSGTTSISSNAVLKILPYTATKTIGIGTGTGDINLSAAELAMFHSPLHKSLYIGDNTGMTSTTTVGALNYSTTDYALELINDNVIFSGNVTGNAYNLAVNTTNSTGSITQSAGTITASSIDLYSGAGIGTSSNRLNINVNSFGTISALGDVYITEGDTLTTGTVSVDGIFDLQQNGVGTATLDLSAISSSQLIANNPNGTLNIINSNATAFSDGVKHHQRRRYYRHRRGRHLKNHRQQCH